jgi:hypothetical protein
MLFVSLQREVAQKKALAGLQSYLGKHGRYARGDKEAKELIKMTSDAQPNIILLLLTKLLADKRLIQADK